MAAAKKHEPRYKDIEVPVFSEDKIPSSYLGSLSDHERDMVSKISLLEQAVEFQLRSIAVKNFIISDIDQRLQEAEERIEKQDHIMKPVVYIGGIVVPLVVTAVATYVLSKLKGQ